MGKASRKKRPIQAKARRSNMGFTIVVTAIVVLGVAGIALSRGGDDGTSDDTPPTLQDHWHSAYAVNICGVIQPNMPQPSRLLGIHTHNDGLIHIEPQVTLSALDRGKNATLARYAESMPGMKLSSSEIQAPGGKLMKNGDLCDKDPGTLTIRQWENAGSDEFKDYTNPKDVKITDGGAITMAFLPESRKGEIAKPPSIPNLANPNAGEGGGMPGQ
ncbi:MAG TPA: hypothetical protein VFF24_03770 [Acidimicrobiia bacterium]|nr:hypothetical protein [Acidimicrobiia bacterium]